MHHIYTTESFIIKREPLGESAYYIILTKDLGLLRARAQGIRGVQSKLKGTLQEFSLATISFVHGKTGWKITTALPNRNLWNELAGKTKVRKILTRISQAVTRLIAGQENNPEIFSIISSGLVFIAEHPDSADVVEPIIIVRLLHALGYVALTDQNKNLFEHIDDFKEEVLEIARRERISLIMAVNKGFKESQM